MADLAVPGTLGDRLRDIERRLRNIERSPQLISSSVRGGTFRVYDEDGDRVISIGQNGTLASTEFYDASGNVIARLGQQSDSTVGTVLYDSGGDVIARFGALDSGARNGVEVFNGAGTRILRADERGALEPNVALPFTAVQDVAVSSGTFTTTHRARWEKVKCPFLHLAVDIDCAVGTTGELRVSIVPGTGSTQTSAVKSVPDGALALYHLYITLNADLDDRVTVLMESRRTSGAGSIRTSTPFADFGDYSATATTGGVWT